MLKSAKTEKLIHAWQQSSDSERREGKNRAKEWGASLMRVDSAKTLRLRCRGMGVCITTIDQPT